MNEERMKILKMIEDGKISAEEGAKLLSASSGEAEQAETQKEKKKYGIRNFLGDAVEKIKNSDFDLSFGEYIEFDHVTELKEDELKDMDLNIANGSLELDTWSSAHVKATYNVKVYQVDSVEQGREAFLSEHQLNIKDNLLSLSNPSKKVKVDVHLTVPEKDYDFIKAKLSNGSATLSKVKSDHFKLKTSNGKLQLNEVEGDTLKMETGNGAVTLTEGDFNECEVDTINGAITLGGKFGKSDASAVSGSITVNHMGNRAHTGFYKTTTGSVSVSLPREKRIDGVLRTKVGSINCQLENYKILKEKSDVMNKLLEFEAYEDIEDHFHIEAEAKTGSVTIKPAEEVRLV